MAKTVGEIELLQGAITTALQFAAQTDATQLKQVLDVLLMGVGQMGAVMLARSAEQATNRQQPRAKPPKASPVSSPPQQKRPPSSTDTPSTQNDAQKRPKELSRIQQGIRQAEPSLADQQRALRGKVYGAQNGDVAFRKAAKALVR